MQIEEKYPVMIFKKENKYTVGISKKNQDGTYENAYFPIQFNRGTELEDKTKIYIKKGWLSFYKWEHEGKKGTTFFIKCSEFEILQNTAPKEEEEPATETLEEDPFLGIEIDDNDLPF